MRFLEEWRDGWRTSRNRKAEGEKARAGHVSQPPRNRNIPAFTSPFSSPRLRSYSSAAFPALFVEPKHDHRLPTCHEKDPTPEYRLWGLALTNVPGATRTPDLLLRRQSLYPLSYGDCVHVFPLLPALNSPALKTTSKIVPWPAGR